MKSNATLRMDVQNAIKRQPLLHADQIGVTADHGVVSLFGTVDSCAKKLDAENAASTVIGVKTLVKNIQVEFRDAFKNANGQMGGKVLKILMSNPCVPHDGLTVNVEDGWVTLEGELPWNHQKEAAESAVCFLSGVRGITNNVKIVP
ncbi:BON domain-containing protein [Muricauda sp. CAU 1633]|uniref:BON domain-containing protein n=1 Tax=Allomuricauda sp. CAU 1633 TaxID=2816036 RepID=UPI001A8D4A1D|nr:BON domain-containing protein [Muricauda sp. CAU 1633]MBO0323914.1 BON domain-containing protein [Muricauda sp. CAU 1633]